MKFRKNVNVKKSLDSTESILIKEKAQKMEDSEQCRKHRLAFNSLDIRLQVLNDNELIQSDTNVEETDDQKDNVANEPDVDHQVMWHSCICKLCLHG